jgi:aspartyl/glutamyl-tRNA(Asn/Gln) amidotransferase C subunit
MAIRRDEVERIAELARLEIPEASSSAGGELSKVLDFAATLTRLDLEGLRRVAVRARRAPLREDA